MSAPTTLTPPPSDAVTNTVTTPRKLRGVVRCIHFILATVAGLLLSVVTVSGALVIFAPNSTGFTPTPTGFPLSAKPTSTPPPPRSPHVIPERASNGW